MPGQRIDCNKAEAGGGKTGNQCINCGRIVKYTYRGKVVHRRGYKRMWPDPRKES